MHDDYLWDKTGKPEEDVKQLEEMLQPLRYDQPAPNFTMPVVAMPRRWLAGRVARFAAAAAVVLAIGGWLALQVRQPAWDVFRLEGQPQIGDAAFAEKGKLSVGDWLTTDAGSRARIEVGLIGEVHVGPNSRLRLVDAKATNHRMALERGKMHARIWAPPRLFFVETPSALAVDLGCAYTLEVQEDGSGSLRVEHGWVAFELDGRESFVPEGAMCLTRPKAGPGTPFFEDAPRGLSEALGVLDFDFPGSPGSALPAPQDLQQRKQQALASILAVARPRDSLTLWHLLSRVEEADRGRVFDRMADLVRPPSGVTREGIVSGDRRMRELYWNALGHGSTTWWRFWMGPPPAPR